MRRAAEERCQDHGARPAIVRLFDQREGDAGQGGGAEYGAEDVDAPAGHGLAREARPPG